MKTPYIGVCDFTHARQVRRLLPLFPVELPHRLMVGVMMSYKTLRGIPTKWQHVFPPKETISSIFSSDQVYNCLHYADYDSNLDLGKCLCDAISLCQTGIYALQLDMVWPHPGQIAHGIHTS